MQQFSLYKADMMDFDYVYDLALKFAKEYTSHYDEETVKDLVTHFLTSPGKFVVLCRGKGMIAGMADPFVLNNKLIMATEIAWWVEPEYRDQGLGQQLINCFEFYAKAIGCNLITMVSLDDQLGNYYSKNGYKLFERAYVKEL